MEGILKLDKIDLMIDLDEKSSTFFARSKLIFRGRLSFLSATCTKFSELYRLKDIEGTLDNTVFMIAL